MTVLALRDDQTQWDANQIAVLQAGGIEEDVTEPELMAFLHECQRRKLDPFSRQIYLIGRYDRRKKRKVYRSQTSIDGFRLIARRAADKSGIDYSYEDTIWFDDNGQRHEIWLDADRPPSGAKVVVIRGGSRFDAVARFGAYVQTDSEGNPSGQWRGMADVMTAKCAEALALRKAFPEDLGGIYTEEEMGQADNPQRVQATVEVVREERPAPEDVRPWAEGAIEQATALRSKNAGDKLWRETAAKAHSGEISGEDAMHIQELITARVEDLRQQAFQAAMNQLSENEPWRLKIEELTRDADARDALNELGELITAGTIDARRGQRITRAIVAKYPRATDIDTEVAA